MVANLRSLLATKSIKKKNFPVVKYSYIPCAHIPYQADLIDFFAQQKYYKNRSFILVALDAFSKMDYDVCIKNKSSDTPVQVFKDLFQKNRPFFKTLNREFKNKKLQAFLKQQYIEHFHSHNFDKKQVFKVLRTPGLIKEIRTNSLSIQKLNG